MKTYGYFIFSFFLFINTVFSQVTLVPGGDLLVPRWAHESQVLRNGKVLVFGGNNGDGLNMVQYKSSELYDPASNTWSSTSNMLRERESFSSVLLNNGKAASDFVNVFRPIYIKVGPSLYTCSNVTSLPLTGYNLKGGTWSGTGVSANEIFNLSSAGPGTFELIYTICNLSRKQTITVNPSSIPPVTAHFTKDTICSYTYATLEIERSANMNRTVKLVVE